MHRIGIRPGARLNVHLANCPEFYDLWFAAATLGAAIVPSNPLSTPDELAYQLDHAGCRLSITQPDLRAVVEKAGATQILGVDEAWIEPGDRWAGPSPAQPLAPLGVLYTSGTTSRPKGVLVTHAAYLPC
ncbi:MAG: long-chain fatty acid--CoA ligase, partial [Pseudonocardia sp.]|nr:long-chain fatty acid--CoA ligase [Pseudonocardia sp.]